MKTLFFINGPMGVGKTAVCGKLLRRLEASAYLDGDWCWNINPFYDQQNTTKIMTDNLSLDKIADQILHKEGNP